MNRRKYFAVGSVRGPCGHQHLTVGGAAKCAFQDQSACRKHGSGSYSDRRVFACEGGYARGIHDALPLDRREREEEQTFYEQESIRRDRFNPATEPGGIDIAAAKRLIASEGWAKPSEARAWLEDDRGHGSEFVAEAARTEWKELFGGARLAPKGMLVPYVAAVLSSAAEMERENPGAPKPGSRTATIPVRVYLPGRNNTILYRAPKSLFSHGARKPNLRREALLARHLEDRFLGMVGWEELSEEAYEAAMRSERRNPARRRSRDGVSKEWRWA